MNRAQRRQYETMQRRGQNPTEGQTEQQQQDFLKNREEFIIQISMFNAIFGIRFSGKLTYSPEELKPIMKLEKIPKDRLETFRLNNQTRTREALDKVGFTRVVIPVEPGLFGKTLMLIPKFRKAAFMKLYEDAVIRFGMFYFTFVGEQNGTLVAAVDIRAMSPQEHQAMLKKVAPHKQKEIQNAIKKEDTNGDFSTTGRHAGIPPPQASHS